jgi:hypothetical protein
MMSVAGLNFVHPSTPACVPNSIPRCSTTAYAAQEQRPVEPFDLFWGRRPFWIRVSFGGRTFVFGGSERRS